MTAPPPHILWSGSGTEIDSVVTMSLHCVGTFLAALLITPAFLAVILDSHVTDAGCPRRANRNGKANRACDAF